MAALMQKIAGELTMIQEHTVRIPTAETRLLTDDKAPVEVLSMRAIDQIIEKELAYYKEVFRREGLQGILRAM